jgi:hypothetical protein
MHPSPHLLPATPALPSQLMDIENNKSLYREILEFLSEICVGVTKEEIAQPAFNGLQAFNNYEVC